MPVKFSNPAGVHAPGAYSHAALVPGMARRLVVSGQVGIAPDGTVVEGGPEQIRQALANLGNILAAHGMSQANLVKMTVFLTEPALVDVWRAMRSAWIGGHAPASTLLIVAGLADPRLLVEVEAEATD
jgi:enamine deaminase RidA (YjgF/YER057c/UK114 family)